MLFEALGYIFCLNGLSCLICLTLSETRWKRLATFETFQNLVEHVWDMLFCVVLFVETIMKRVVKLFEFVLCLFVLLFKPVFKRLYLFDA